MAERITIDELKSYLWQSAVLLRTHIDAGAYKRTGMSSNITNLMRSQVLYHTGHLFDI